MTKNPQIVVIGGPNGAGKSTIARRLLPKLGVTEFVNADVIARGLSAEHPETVAIPAGRIMLRRIQELAASNANFAFETTLSARTYASWIGKLRESGWTFRLVFTTLRNADLAVERVANRVIAGGHSIPEEDIRRRFCRAHQNFHELYMPLASKWWVYDNTLPNGPRRIAGGQCGRPPNIIDWQLWEQFCEVGNAT